MSSLQAAFRKRLAKAANPEQYERQHPFAAGTVPRPRPKPQPGKKVFGGSVGDVERQHEHTYGRLPPKALRNAVRKAVQAAQFRPSPADPKRGELPKRPSAAERYAGRAPGSTGKPPRGWGSSRFNPANKPGRMESKHKDKRGSTAHHKREGGGQPRRQLSVPEKHQLRIARQNAEMNPAMHGVVGGPDIEQSKKIIEELTGRPYKQPKVSPWTGRPYNPRGRDWEQRQQREEADIEQRHPKGRRGRERLQEEYGRPKNPWEK